MKKTNKPKIKGAKPVIISFFVLLFIGATLALYIPLRPTYSEEEKRDLAKFPEFSFASLVDGSYFSGISTWYADTFPMRDIFIGAKAKIESFYGIGNSISGSSDNIADEIPDSDSPSLDLNYSDFENNTLPEDEAIDSSLVQKLGAVLIVDDSAYEYYSFVKSTADRYALTVSYTADKLKGKARVFDIVVPTSTDITLNTSVRKEINTSDQKEAINYIYRNISANAYKVDTFDTIYAHRNEYVYFRTDHHWTALGAYYAYCEYTKAAGIKTASLKDFNERKFDNFVGAFYNDSEKNPALEKNPDTVYAYDPKGNVKLTFTNHDGKQVKWNVVTDVSGWSRGSKYNAFIGGDNPYTHIVNPAITDGSSCVVVKESFGNAMVPFLTENYGEIHVIDYRYWDGNISEFVEENGVDDVIFVNNISATRNNSLVNKLGKIS